MNQAHLLRRHSLRDYIRSTGGDRFGASTCLQRTHATKAKLRAARVPAAMRPRELAKCLGIDVTRVRLLSSSFTHRAAARPTPLGATVLSRPSICGAEA